MMRRAGQILLASLGAGISVALIGWTVQLLSQRTASAWLFARAAGLCAYLIMMALVLVGTALADPRRSRRSSTSRTARIRLHLALAVFMVCFTAGHIVVLALDEKAGIGWLGALVPLASSYHPVPVALGVLATYAALIATVTAALAGHVLGRHWAVIHRAGALIALATWLHAVLTGTDSDALQWFYVITGVMVATRVARRHLALAGPTAELHATWIPS
ncbi:MAG: hypothetical protein IPK24_01435 [Kineosporiaceae bacterium]|nr:hypothetical protein [Kineosporiaceae bacterium]